MVPCGRSERKSCGVKRIMVFSLRLARMVRDSEDRKVQSYPHRYSDWAGPAEVAALPLGRGRPGHRDQPARAARGQETTRPARRRGTLLRPAGAPAAQVPGRSLTVITATLLLVAERSVSGPGRKG